MFLVNGTPSHTVHVLDRGLQYGDGLFETIRVEHGDPLRWARHMRRLAWGCKRLHMPPPDEALLAREAEIVTAGVGSGVLKIVLTRGEGGRGYRPPKAVQTTRVLSAHPLPEYPATHSTEGVAVRLCQTRLAINPTLAGIKHLNRLEQVLARAEWDEPEIAEGLMLDTSGRIVEGTMTNLFIVQSGTALTPDLSQCGVRGIMREMVMEVAAEQSIPTCITDLRPDHLRRADELFVCNSLVGVWPVRKFEDVHYPLGPVTRRIAEALEQQGR